jgi:ABC-type transporter Mla subunit MlaD
MAPAPTADILHASEQQVRAANDAMNAWAAESRARIQCRGAELQQLQAQARAALTAYNDRVTQFTAIVDAWNAQTETLNARRRAQRR